MTITHPEMVRALVKPGAAILDSFDAAKADLIHGAVGIAGEAGELLDAVKKHVIYNKLLDRENVIEELGDLEFYMEQVRQNLGISREETLAANISKLSVRYASLTYTDEAAQARADKAEIEPDSLGSGNAAPLSQTEAQLTAEYNLWFRSEGLREADAIELLHEDLTPDQRSWLSDFVLRWEAMQGRRTA